MSEAALLTEQDGHVLTVTINRPEKKNAVNAEVLCGLSDAWRRLDTDDELRVCILTGAGDNFCAGMDLSVINKLTSNQPPDDDFEARLKSEPNIIFEAIPPGFTGLVAPDEPMIRMVSVMSVGMVVGGSVAARHSSTIDAHP